ncbi:hypothetical protein [Pseudaestuariivita atlantica]|uniref:Uncharacterized protein n=1 Tax=Pseudaestuariivita atlantica TaxID=1317121 RepID=A0A0L1JUG9_9RHOB|nr:hypothetical protein [Pseudaestuariivita atlantica]KNG95411.1 hypothetical protein ATO11_02055 [Pseudaestuariivita atlantica]
MDQFFTTRMPGLRFLRNVLMFSVAGLLPVLIVYVLLTPGFAAALGKGGANLSRFVRQVLTNGLPVVFVVNYIGFFIYALSREPGRTQRDPAWFIAVDVVLRVSVFFALHAVIYVLSADWFGSFGGSRATALSVVAPTLARSAMFENISGVYLYATLVSAVPLYVSLAGRSTALRPVLTPLPTRSGPLVVAVIAFVAGVALLTVLARAVVWLQSLPT